MDTGTEEVEEYCGEMAEEREINECGNGDEEPEEDEVLSGGEGKLDGDAADGHLGVPAKVGQYIDEKSLTVNRCPDV